MFAPSSFFVLASLTLALAACGGRSDDELRAELADFVAAANACQAPSDCVAAFVSCPLGCYAAVNRTSQASVEAKAQELVQERGGGTTECECTAAPAVTCTAGHCAR